MTENSIQGTHAVQAVLKKHPERINRLIVANEKKNKHEQLIAQARGQGVSIEFWPQDTLDKKAGNNHQGIMAYAKPPKAYTEHDLIEILDASDIPFVLILDGVQDPHNLGACLRTADAVGVDCVVIPKDRSVSLNATVCKVASGAAETVPVVTVTNISRTIKDLQERGIWVYGTDESGSNTLYATDLKGPIAWVMGAEGQGLRRLTKESCDVRVQIPMAGYVSSLNVSVASAVVLFETVRQRS